MTYRPFRFECDIDVHTTGDLTVCQAWVSRMNWRAERVTTCGRLHCTTLQVGNQWLPLIDAATPGHAVNVQVAGRRLTDYRPLAFLPDGCPASAHADDQIVGWVVRRTVIDGVLLNHHTLTGRLCPVGFDAAVRPGGLYMYRHVRKEFDHLMVDRNNWARIDRLFACGHRTEPTYLQ